MKFEKEVQNIYLNLWRKKYLLQASLQHKAFRWLCLSEGSEHLVWVWNNAGVTAILFIFYTPTVSIVEYMFKIDIVTE